MGERLEGKVVTGEEGLTRLLSGDTTVRCALEGIGEVPQRKLCLTQEAMQIRARTLFAALVCLLQQRLEHLSPVLVSIDQELEFADCEHRLVEDPPISSLRLQHLRLVGGVTSCWIAQKRLSTDLRDED